MSLPVNSNRRPWRRLKVNFDKIQHEHDASAFWADRNSRCPSLVSDWLGSLTWRLLITDADTSVIVSDQDRNTDEAEGLY